MSSIFESESLKEVFFEEMEELVDKIDECALSLEKNPLDKEKIEELFRHVHTMKGSSGVCGVNEISDLAHHAETVLEQLRSGQLKPSTAVFHALFQCFDRLKKIIQLIKNDQSAEQLDNEEIIQSLVQYHNKSQSVEKQTTTQEQKNEDIFYRIEIKNTEKIFQAGGNPLVWIRNCQDISMGDFSVDTKFQDIPTLDILNPEVCYLEFQFIFSAKKTLEEMNEIFEFAHSSCDIKIEALSGSHAKEEKKISPSITSSATGKMENNSFIRIKKERLDSLINMTGELLTVKNTFQHLLDRFDIFSIENEMTKMYRDNLRQFSKLTTQIQDTVMESRLLPIGSIFKRYVRVVRDLSKKLNKDVNFVIEGEDTEIDGSLGAVLFNPLLHIIRNAMDHGIESQEDRKKSQKKPQGTILLKAQSQGDHILITVGDDGHGLNPNIIKQKAVEAGLTTEEKIAELSKNEIFEFIFRSGFSTTSEVTDVSGRGVGMDVVRKTISKAGGSIVIDNKPGEGCTFRISLPVNLALMSVILFESGKETYALSDNPILEVMQPRKDEMVTLNRRPALKMRGEIIPILDLNQLLATRRGEKSTAKNQTHELTHHSKIQEIKENPVIVMQIDTLKFGIIVEHLKHKEEILIKPLPGFIGSDPLFTGACILGDGRAVFVMDHRELYKDALRASA